MCLCVCFSSKIPLHTKTSTHKKQTAHEKPIETRTRNENAHKRKQQPAIASQRDRGRHGEVRQFGRECFVCKCVCLCLSGSFTAIAKLKCSTSVVVVCLTGLHKLVRPLNLPATLFGEQILQQSALNILYVIIEWCRVYLTRSAKRGLGNKAIDLTPLTWSPPLIEPAQLTS